MAGIIGILAPYGRDAQVISELLKRAGIGGLINSTIDETIAAVADGRADAAMIAEEAFNQPGLNAMTAWLQSQPPWSDLPILLLTKRVGNIAHQSDLAARLGNVTVLERPFSLITLISGSQAALRARARQRQAENQILQLAAQKRELTAERARLETSQAQLREANEKLGQRFAEALAEKRVLADIVEGNDAFVQVADLNYKWLALNHASADGFERIYGVRPEVGKSMLDVLDHMPEHRKAVQAMWGRALAGEEFTEIVEFGDSASDRRFYEMKYNSLRNEQGEQIGAYQFVYDVTDRIREQQQLADAQERVHEMAKLEMLGRLTGGVAHDFNNLLTPIIGMLDLLHLRHEKDPRSLRLIMAALESAQRAAVLVQRLLTFARRQHLRERVVNIGELIEGLRDLIQRSIGPHVRVKLTIEQNLPTVRIDPNQLELAVLNLAVNSSDAMPNGGFLAIDLSQRSVAKGEIEGLKGGAYIRLAVVDSGMGMDEETISRSIEPFFTTKGIGKGTGLGLSMVHGLAAQSGGTLHLESVLGHGTTAAIWLPVNGNSADPRVLPEAVLPLTTRRAVILIVDDEESVLRAMADMLREMGHEIIEASSGVAALQVLREREDVELVVSDYLMPGMRGGELIRAAQQLRPHLKGLLITGYAKLADQEAGGEASNRTGMALLSKPFRAADLAFQIEKLLSEGTGASLTP